MTELLQRKRLINELAKETHYALRRRVLGFLFENSSLEDIESFLNEWRARYGTYRNLSTATDLSQAAPVGRPPVLPKLSQGRGG